MRKPDNDFWRSEWLTSFSPLAGIRYAETLAACLTFVEKSGFSPLAGIRYAETFSRPIHLQQ